MRIGEYSLEEAARLARGNWQQFGSFGWHEQPDDPQEWAIVYTENRDSRLLDKSNAAAIAKTMEPFFDAEPRDIYNEHHSHWACGWIDGYAIRVYRDGKITDAFRAYWKLSAALAEYPVLDETDYSQREYDATMENITQEGRRANRDDAYSLPDGWEGETYRWLSDNDQSAVENKDDQGGCPSEEELRAAWDALGWRILYVVRWVDCGEEAEEYPMEQEAAARCAELRAAGFTGAAYSEELPQHV